MTKDDVRKLISQLEVVFDSVRLIDVSMTSQYTFKKDGDLTIGTYQCYAVWNKNRRCENCISAKAFASKGKMSKFEFIGNEVYYVIAMYIEMDGVPYMLEMVSSITDETLFGAYGKNEFVDTITNYNKKLYIDPLTGAYNRQYYEEQLSQLINTDAIAMVDVDNLKKINDTFGHQIGDLALRTIVNIMLSHVRGTDTVIRYGGDEFLIIFKRIPNEVFKERLERIRKSVDETVLLENPDIRLSISIGGVYCGGKCMNVVQVADTMLYQAKATKNNVQISQKS